MLFLSLAGFEVEDRTSFIGLLNREMSQLFRSFSHLMPALYPSEIDFFNLISKGGAELHDLSKSLSFLSPILARVYKRPLFLLLDEYDAAVNTVWEKALKAEKGAQELLDLVVRFFGSFYENSVKLNTSLIAPCLQECFVSLKAL